MSQQVPSFSLFFLQFTEAKFVNCVQQLIYEFCAWLFQSGVGGCTVSHIFFRRHIHTVLYVQCSTDLDLNINNQIKFTFACNGYFFTLTLWFFSLFCNLLRSHRKVWYCGQGFCSPLYYTIGHRGIGYTNLYTMYLTRALKICGVFTYSVL